MTSTNLEWAGTLLIQRVPQDPDAKFQKGNHIVLSLVKVANKPTWHCVSNSHATSDRVPPADTGQTDMALAQRIAQVIVRLES